MARSDLLLNLIRSQKNGDTLLFARTVEAIIAEERAKNHHILANQLKRELHKGQQKDDLEAHQVSPATLDIRRLLHKTSPQISLDNLVLDKDVLGSISDLIEENNRVELLRSYNLEPRNRVLLLGPPGNGKTSVAEAIAKSISVPMYTVKYDGLIGSFLGETNQRMRKVFDFARTNRCVLFFDEFDTVGKDRGDHHETGEIKRVVSSLLLDIDALPPYVVVIAASNHQELLDKAVWRRFQLRLNLNKPNSQQIGQWLSQFEQRASIAIGPTMIKQLSESLKGLSYSEIEEFSLSVLRKFVLKQPEAKTKKIIETHLKQYEDAGLIKPVRRNARK